MSTVDCLHCRTAVPVVLLENGCCPNCGTDVRDAATPAAPPRQSAAVPTGEGAVPPVAQFKADARKAGRKLRAESQELDGRGLAAMLCGSLGVCAAGVGLFTPLLLAPIILFVGLGASVCGVICAAACRSRMGAIVGASLSIAGIVGMAALFVAMQAGQVEIFRGLVN